MIISALYKDEIIVVYIIDILLVLIYLLTSLYGVCTFIVFDLNCVVEITLGLWFLPNYKPFSAEFVEV